MSKIFKGLVFGILISTVVMFLGIKFRESKWISIHTEIGTYHYGDQFPVGEPLIICTVVGGKGITLTLECSFPELRPPSR